MNKTVMKFLPQIHFTQNAYKGEKLSSHFSINDSTKLEHQGDLTYFTQCSEVNFNEICSGETAKRLRERVLGHAGNDKDANMVKNSVNIGHPPACMKDFQILTKGFNNCKFMRKIYEAFYI